MSNSGCAGCFSLVVIVVGALVLSASAGPKWGLAGAAVIGLSTLLLSASQGKRD